MAAPIYLYTGPEAGERNDQVKLQKEALKKKFGSSDDYVYYGTDLNMSEIVAQLMTESLFIPATSVVIKNAELIKDEKSISLISQWLQTVEKTGNESAILILTSDELKVDARLEKLVPAQNKKIFWEMFENRKEQWLFNFFKKNGYSIEPEAAALVLDMIENNTEELRNECSRFFMCFPAGHCVTQNDVEQILSHNREESAFTLFDAMVENEEPQKKLENCLLILQKIRLSKKDNDSFVIISGLLYCFRKLAVWQTIHAGKSPDDLELKKNGFTSKKSQTQYSKAARIWSPGQVAAIQALLSKTDADIRSLGAGFQDTQLSIMLYEIIVKNGVFCSRYETD